MLGRSKRKYPVAAKKYGEIVSFCKMRNQTSLKINVLQLRLKGAAQILKRAIIACSASPEVLQSGNQQSLAIVNIFE